MNPEESRREPRQETQRLSPSSFGLRKAFFENCERRDAVKIISAALQYASQEHGELSDKQAEQLDEFLLGALTAQASGSKIDVSDIVLSYPCGASVSLSAFATTSVVNSGTNLLVSRHALRFGADMGSVPLRVHCSFDEIERLYSVALVWEEELARRLSSEPDRWEGLNAVAEQLLESDNEPPHLGQDIPQVGLKPGQQVEIIEGKAWAILGDEKPSFACSLLDEHLAARADLLPYVITRSLEERESNRLEILKKLFGHCSITSLDLEGRTREELEQLLAEAKEAFNPEGTAADIAFIEIDDLLIPVGPRTTLDALQADFDLLTRIKLERSSEYLRRDSAELLSFRIESVKAGQIAKVLSILKIPREESCALNVCAYLMNGDQLTEETLFNLCAQGNAKVEHGVTLVSEAGQEAQLSRYIEVFPKGNGGTPTLRLYGVAAELPELSASEQPHGEEGRALSDEPVDFGDDAEEEGPDFDDIDPTELDSSLAETEILFPDRIELRLDWDESEDRAPSADERAARMVLIDRVLSLIRRHGDLPETLPQRFEDLPVGTSEVDGNLVADLYTRHLNAEVTITLSPFIRGCLA